MAKIQKSKYGVAQTKSTFKIRGIVFGTKKNSFYNDEGKRRTVSFGVNINENKPIYCRLQGFTRDKVYYSNQSETIAVDWANRMKQPKNGFEIIGVRIGLETDDTGNNVVKNMTEFDAAQYLSKELRDGLSVVIIGDLETYIGNDGTTKTNYVPRQIYLEDDIDFHNSDFEEKAIFYQTLVYTDMEKETDENGKQTGRVIMNGYDINYSNVCKVKYTLAGVPLEKAGAIRKKMKPFYSVDVSGYIDVIVDTTDAEDDEDNWGDMNELGGKKRMNGPVRREFVVTAMKPDTIDEERYDEESVMAAIQQMNSEREARKNFGEKPNTGVGVSADDWGDDDEDDGNSPW